MLAVDLGLDALGKAGPWLVVAAIAITLLFGVVQVLVFNPQLVPYGLLKDERARLDKLVTLLADVTTALNRLTDTVRELKEMIATLTREILELRQKVEDQRRKIEELTSDLETLRRQRGRA